MASKNGHYDLDLTDLVEPIRLKIGAYTGELAPDIPLSIIVRMQKVFEPFAHAGELDHVDEEAFASAEGELMRVVEQVLKHATPPIDKPVRSFMTVPAALRLLAFLVPRLTEAMEGMTSSLGSSPSSTISGAESASVN